MGYDNKIVAGSALFIGAAQFALAIVCLEAIYPGYSVGQQAVSDLGDWSLAGTNAAIFNISAILMGILTIVCAYYIQKALKSRLFTSFLIIVGIGEIAVGIVSEDILMSLHAIFAIFVFVFSGAAMIMSYKFEKSPLRYISVILGIVLFIAFVLSMAGYAVDPNFFMGLGYGGMERLIIYPLILWSLGFGAYLIGDSSTVAAAKATT